MTDEPKSGQVQETGLTTTTEQTGELSATETEASATMEIQAAYLMACKYPRKEEQAYAEIQSLCNLPEFAEDTSAVYRKPVGGGHEVEGAGIRLAEEMARLWKNIMIRKVIIYDDEERRKCRWTVTDVQNNTSYSEEKTIKKTVERKDGRNREIVSERVNSYGQVVYVVKSTEAEMQIKESATGSIVTRNLILRLIPHHIKNMAIQAVKNTRLNRAKDNIQEGKRKIIDAFNSINIKPDKLEKYLAHDLDTISPTEVVDLRAIYGAIKNGETTWNEVIKSKLETPDAPLEPETSELPEDFDTSFDTGDISTHTAPDAPVKGKRRGRPKKKQEGELFE